MTTPRDPKAPVEGDADPWAAFGYLVSGVLFYGLIGLGLSKWLHAAYWIPIGILVGAGFGMYLVFARYRVHPPTAVKSSTDETTNPAARESRPDDDRGETA
jgi:ATP synthase protein I